MSAETIVVIDAGTSNLRAVAVTRDGDVSMIGAESWPMFVPEDTGPYGRELRIKETRAALRRLIEKAGALGDRVAAIATCGQREGVVFCDERGDPLLISPNIDARASAEGMAIDAVHKEEVYRTYGRLPSLIMAPAKMQWLRNDRPRDAELVRWVLPLADWLGAELCGERVISRSLGPEIGVADVRTGEAAGELAGLLPPIVAEGTIIGTGRCASVERVPVVNAGADTQCALLGSDACCDGSGAAVVGTTAAVQMASDRTGEPSTRIWRGLHVVPKLSVLESNAGEAGSVWSWICAIAGVAVEDADEHVRSTAAGANDSLAIMGPRSMDAQAMSAGVGALAFPLPFVMGTPTRADLLRAVLEGIAFSIRSNWEQIEECHGVNATVRLAGGMSRSIALAEILANVFDRSVVCARSHHTSSLGAAMLAFAALGRHELPFHLAADTMAQPWTTVEPSAKTAAIYEDVYGRWCEAAERLEREPL